MKMKMKLVLVSESVFLQSFVTFLLEFSLGLKHNGCFLEIKVEFKLLGAHAQ